MPRVKSADGQTFVISRGALAMSHLLRGMLEDCEVGEDEVIPIDGVGGDVLRAVIEYCEFHSGGAGGATVETAAAFDVRFARRPPRQLFALIAAAQYLNIEALQTMLTKRVAASVGGGKPTAAIRAALGLPEQTEDEARHEREIRETHPWAFVD